MLRSLYLMILGTACMAFAVNSIFEPMGMVIGGLTGLGITLNRILELLHFNIIPLWLINLIGNAPLILIARITLGRNFLWKTILGILLHSFFLYVIPVYPILEGDILLGAAVGGILSGGGIGLVFQASASTGGSDLLSFILAGKKHPHMAPGILLWIDGVVVAAGAVVFGLNKSIYAIFAVWLVSKVSDLVLAGFHYTKAVYIMSREPEALSSRIMKDIQRGVTTFDSVGMYSGREGKTVFCVISKREVRKMEELIQEIDPEAFVVILDARQVMGNGFMEIQQ